MRLLRLLFVLVLSPAGSTWAPEPNAGVALSERVDLRNALEQFGLGARQQGSRPTCSAFTITSALEFALARQHGKTPRLSVEFLNWAANERPGDRDGGFFSELWQGYARHGICTESEFPYEEKFDSNRRPDTNQLAQAKTRLASGLRLQWIKEWNVKTGLVEEQFKRIQQVLRDGWPVCAGMRWPIQARWKGDILQMCKPDEVVDGHSVLLVGFQDDISQAGGGVFFCRNTGGNGRDAAIPYAFIREYVNDAAWVAFASSAAQGSSPAASGLNVSP